MLLFILVLWISTCTAGSAAKWCRVKKVADDGCVTYKWVKCDDDKDKCDEFSYDEDADNGPDKWGDICKDWETCGDGESQSPIDIVTDDVTDEDGTLDQHYNKKFNVTVKDDKTLYNFIGYVNGKEKLDADGLEETYKLISFSYHTPAEHTVDGKQYPLELQLLHHAVKDDDKIAILSVFYEGSSSKTSASLDKFIAAVEEVLDADEDYETLLKLRDEIFYDDPENLPYYSYTGSLTVPPCTEDVIWLILTTPLTAGNKQIKKLKGLIGNPEGDGNARPIQDLNDREVTKYEHVEEEEEEEDDDDDSYSSYKK